MNYGGYGMKRGPDIDLIIPDKLNLATYYLDENLIRGRGRKTALLYEGQKYTFNELVALTNRIGNVLKDLNLFAEDRALLILQDSPEWVASWYATHSGE